MLNFGATTLKCQNEKKSENYMLELWGLKKKTILSNIYFFQTASLESRGVGNFNSNPAS